MTRKRISCYTVLMNEVENAHLQKSRHVTELLYPNETWIPYNEFIFVAQSRMPVSKSQSEVFEKDIAVARVRQILRGVLKDKSADGVVYCYFCTTDTFHTWQMKDLK